MDEPKPCAGRPSSAADTADWQEPSRALEQIFNTIADPVFIKDEAHRWVWLNDAYCAFMGHPRTDLLGKSDGDFFPPEEAAIFWAKDQEVLDLGAANSNEECFTDASGVQHVIVTKKSLFETPDGQRFIIGVIRDVTALRMVQDELARRAEELERANRRLQDLDQAKSNLLNAVSHELRTPLTTITGFAEFLADGIGGSLTPAQLTYVLQVQRGADRLRRLVDDLLDISGLESGVFKVLRQETDLVGLVQSCLQSLQHQADEKQLALEAVLPEQAVPIRIDARRIAQVLHKLLDNALKFTPPHGCVQVSLRAQGDGVRVEVQDSGPGIDPAHQRSIFEKFYQVNPTLTREHGGTGLGLSIAKALVEAHQGGIGVASTPGQGSCFWFTLPAAPAL